MLKFVAKQMAAKQFVLVIFNFTKRRGIFLSAPLFLILLVGCDSTMPTNLGVKDNKLSPCPESPNCVVSFYAENDADHFLNPIESQEDPALIRTKIEGIIGQEKSAKIISSTEDYIHAEYRSAIFSFVDDVEFWFGESGKVHFRSASRTGHSDMGVNKKRIESIRFKFHQNDYK